MHVEWTEGGEKKNEFVNNMNHNIKHVYSQGGYHSSASRSGIDFVKANQSNAILWMALCDYWLGHSNIATGELPRVNGTE